MKSKAQNVWRTLPGQDFLHLMSAQGKFLAAIDSDGIGKGNLAYPVIPNLFDLTGIVNVRDFGAKGDTKLVTDGILSNGTGLISSESANFTQADLGKTIYAVENVHGGPVALSTGIIEAVISSTQVRSSATGTTPYTNLLVVWGSLDGASIYRAMDFIAGQLAETGKQASLYLPAGIYLSELAPIIDVPNGTQGMKVFGEHEGATTLLLTPTVDLATGSQGQFISSPSGSNCSFQDLVIDGANIVFGSGANNAWAVFFNGHGQLSIERIFVNRFAAGSSASNIGFYINGCTAVTLRQVIIASSTTGMLINACSGLSAYDSGGTNCSNENLIISNLGLEKTGQAAKFFGGTFDENGNNTGATVVQNCSCVHFFGITMFGPPEGIALSIQNSTVRMLGCFAGPFNIDDNTTGIEIDSTSTLYLTNSHITHSGSGVAISNTQGGSYVDGGCNLLD